jgi:hypothetical protein
MGVKWWSLALAGLVLTGALVHTADVRSERGPMAIVIHVNMINQTAVLNGSGSEQGVSLSGEVRVDYIIIPVHVVLSSSTDLAWATNVTPREMTFNSSGLQYFNADVSIPAGIYNRTATLTVKGNATISGIPADTSSDTATIAVNGPGEGTQPKIPVVPPPKGGGASVVIPNLPLITAAVSAAVVASMALVFWRWKSQRLKKDVIAQKKSGHGND